MPGTPLLGEGALCVLLGSWSCACACAFRVGRISLGLLLLVFDGGRPPFSPALRCLPSVQSRACGPCRPRLIGRYGLARGPFFSAAAAPLPGAPSAPVQV
eukprot:7759720-Pyramimonas_sp.AAC.1